MIEQLKMPILIDTHIIFIEFFDEISAVRVFNLILELYCSHCIDNIISIFYIILLQS